MEVDIVIHFCRINIFLENGLVKRWDLMFSPKDVCAYNKTHTFLETASLAHVHGAFITLLGGLVVAAVTLTMEIIIYIYRRKQRGATWSNQVMKNTIQHTSNSTSNNTGLEEHKDYSNVIDTMTE